MAMLPKGHGSGKKMARLSRQFTYYIPSLNLKGFSKQIISSFRADRCLVTLARVTLFGIYVLACRLKPESRCIAYLGGGTDMSQSFTRCEIKKKRWKRRSGTVFSIPAFSIAPGSVDRAKSMPRRYAKCSLRTIKRLMCHRHRQGFVVNEKEMGILFPEMAARLPKLKEYSSYPLIALTHLMQGRD